MSSGAREVPELDYREILRKYISHVFDVEGTTFVASSPFKATEFTEAEWAELEKMDNAFWEARRKERLSYE